MTGIHVEFGGSVQWREMEENGGKRREITEKHEGGEGFLVLGCRGMLQICRRCQKGPAVVVTHTTGRRLARSFCVYRALSMAYLCILLCLACLTLGTCARDFILKHPSAPGQGTCTCNCIVRSLVVEGNDGKKRKSRHRAAKSNCMENYGELTSPAEGGGTMEGK
eukprot:gene23523-biopygen10356